MAKDWSPEAQIFGSEFDDVNRKLGDAVGLADKPEEAFFKDNVKRYVDHDELHARVARMNRGKVAMPLFRRFQLGDGNVEMDQALFMQATPQDRLDTLKEEIMVLFLERKAIPAAVEHGAILSFDQTSLRPSEIKELDAPYDPVSPGKYEYDANDERDKHDNQEPDDTSVIATRSVIL